MQCSAVRRGEERRQTERHINTPVSVVAQRLPQLQALGVLRDGLREVSVELGDVPQTLVHLRPQTRVRAEQSRAEQSREEKRRAQHSTTQHNTAHHSAAQHSTSHHSTKQHSAAHHITSHHITA